MKKWLARRAKLAKAKKTTADYDINGYSRIYQYHIRKTGGTSIKNSVYSTIGDPKNINIQIVKDPDHMVFIDNFVLVRWNRPMLNSGYYYFGGSHSAMHELDIPKAGTYTFTMFRDPIKRFFSYYNYLLDLQKAKDEGRDSHPELARAKFDGSEGPAEFANRLPKHMILDQLHMFSKEMNAAEALENLQTLNRVFFTSEFQNAFDTLNQDLDLGLESLHSRKTQTKSEVSQDQQDLVAEVLKPELEFFEEVKQQFATNN